jgi:hypothetical protein
MGILVTANLFFNTLFNYDNEISREKQISNNLIKTKKIFDIIQFLYVYKTFVSLFSCFK